MKVSPRRASSNNSIDLSPMLDVIFQLILFFLVSTTFAVLPAISVKLPESSTASGVEISSITITAQEDGKLWFNEEEVNLKTLEKKLMAFDCGEIPRNEFPVSISADDKVTNGTIVGLFDALRRSGFSAVSLRTTGKTK